MDRTVFAPATVANLGVGFDRLGAAVNPVDGSRLGDQITVETIEKGIELECRGAYAHCLPSENGDNIVFQCAERFFSALPDFERRTGVRLILDKGLPVGSGLGSSASSVVAALYALNQFFEQPLNQQELLGLMGQMEGVVSGSVHYDNVAPSCLGGLQLMVQSVGRICEDLPFFEHWFWILAYPGISLSTAKMRALLPARYDRGDVIKFGHYLSSFVHALYRRDQPLAISMLNDVVAEPYRSSHIPGYLKAKAALSEIGVLGSGISGSGPTLFAIADDLKTAREAEELLRATYLSHDGGFVRVCRIDRRGARVLSKNEAV